MSDLRKYIPVEVRCRVILRQLGEMWPDAVIEENRGAHEALLGRLLDRLAALLDAERLHLDHNPPLAARKKVVRHGAVVGCKPDANDPNYLLYREKRSHQVKTNIRGDRGQYPDRVLIKKSRRLEREPRKRQNILGPKKRRKPKKQGGKWKQQRTTWPKRPFRQKSRPNSASCTGSRKSAAIYRPGRLAAGAGRRSVR